MLSNNTLAERRAHFVGLHPKIASICSNHVLLFNLLRSLMVLQYFFTYVHLFVGPLVAVCGHEPSDFLKYCFILGLPIQLDPLLCNRRNESNACTSSTDHVTAISFKFDSDGRLANNTALYIYNICNFIFKSSGW